MLNKSLELKGTYNSVGRAPSMAEVKGLDPFKSLLAILNLVGGQYEKEIN